MKKALTFCLLLITFSSFAKRPNYYVRIKTAFGDCIIRLYNETPLHRDNFIKLTEKGHYNGTLFHRVIQNFMIPGGDPDSKNAAPGIALGEGGLKYTVPAEFKDSLFHKRGVLAAARDNNPEKASSACQFYIVTGRKYTDQELDRYAQRNGRKFTPRQREIYKNEGGTAMLDGNYTVYGIVLEGMDVVEKISDRIIIIGKGEVIADGSFESLQNQAHLGSLENIFTSLTGGSQQNTITAKEFIDVLRG